MIKTLRSLLSLTSLMVLGACAVGPNYLAPASKPAATGAFVTKDAPVQTAEVRDDWWKLFNDPVLDQLVQDALKSNTDIRVAVARLDRARANLRGSRADRLPSTTLTGTPNYGRLPESQRQPGAPQPDWQVDAGLNVAYELDLSGRVRRNIEAARGDVAAADADADAVRIAIVADTTRAYVDAASAAERLVVARQIVDLLDHSTQLIGRRADVGRAERLDVARIAALRDQRRADVPRIIAQRQAALFRLATLTGHTPAELPPIAAARTTTPSVVQPIPVGDGAALLARRPDVRAAERRLAANTARIGVATAELYPRITLGGSIGSTGAGFSDFFGGGPFRWLVGPTISWSFLNQSAARAHIAAAKADRDGSLATFDGTVLRALEETETALSNYGRTVDRQAALVSARNEASKAVTIVRARQREGTGDFLDVLDAERTSSETQSQLADATADVAAAQVDLFRALGGGWATSKP